MTLYRKKALQELIEWEERLPMGLVSISQSDLDNGSPRKGDMIAFNPKDATNMWLVAEKFFNDNYELEKPSIKTDNSQVIINQDKKIAELEEAIEDLQSVLFGLYHLAKPYAEDGENKHLVATLHEAAKQLEKYGESK